MNNIAAIQNFVNSNLNTPLNELISGGGLKLGDRVCKKIEVQFDESIMTDYIETNIINERCVLECLYISQPVDKASIEYEIFDSDGLSMPNSSSYTSGLQKYDIRMVGPYGYDEITKAAFMNCGSIYLDILSCRIPFFISSSTSRCQVLFDHINPKNSGDGSSTQYWSYLRKPILNDLSYRLTFRKTTASTYEEIKKLSYQISVSYYPILN